MDSGGSVRNVVARVGVPRKLVRSMGLAWRLQDVQVDGEKTLPSSGECATQVPRT